MTDLDPIVFRAAKLYYDRNYRQDQVAKKLGVSRASVAGYLQKARDAGLVEIKLRADLFRRHELAIQLEEYFGLDAVYITASEGNEDTPYEQQARLDDTARLGANVLLDHFQNGDKLGVAWGQTLYRLADLLPKSPRKDAIIVQLCGNLGTPFGYAPEECVSKIARQFNADSRNLYAPLVLSSPEMAEALRQEPFIAAQLEELSHCNKVVFSIGECAEGSHIVQCGAVTKMELKEYRLAGARGVIAGRFILEDGEPMDYHHGDRVIGITLNQLRQAPFRLAVATGAAKANAVFAGLLGRYATHLVLDDQLAQAVLSLCTAGEQRETG